MDSSQRKESEVWAWTLAVLKYFASLGLIVVAIRLALALLFQDVDELVMGLRFFAAFVASGAVFGFLIGLMIVEYRKHWEKRHPELAEKNPDAK